MTNREYIMQKLTGFNVTEAILVDTGLDLSAEYSPSEEMDKALLGMLEELILMPSMKSVSESGFSVSWDKSSVGKWYTYLCKKYNITPNNDVLSLLGISMIIDISDIW